jgi:hypothetical protein
MDKKYQVFISSTYKDLIEQRNQVVEVVLRLSHLPVGMEIFNAASATPWDVIKSHIDNSDYYVLIIAHRYGSEDPETGIGYTEKEYDYAISRGIPCLAFVLHDSVQWSPDLMEQKPGPKKKLATFKKKIHVHHVSYWYSTEDLANKVLLALVDETRNKPGIGWVRANAVTSSPVVAEELSRLSKENSELKDKLSSVETQKSDEYDELEQIITASARYIVINDEKKIFSLRDLFWAICTHQDAPIASRFGEYMFGIQQDVSARYESTFSSGARELKTFGLVITKGYMYGEDIWQLTEKGQRLYIKLRAATLVV